MIGRGSCFQVHKVPETACAADLHKFDHQKKQERKEEAPHTSFSDLIRLLEQQYSSLREETANLKLKIASLEQQNRRARKEDGSFAGMGHSRIGKGKSVGGHTTRPLIDLLAESEGTADDMKPLNRYTTNGGDTAKGDTARGDPASGDTANGATRANDLVPVYPPQAQARPMSVHSKTTPSPPVGIENSFKAPVPSEVPCAMPAVCDDEDEIVEVDEMRELPLEEQPKFPRKKASFARMSFWPLQDDDDQKKEDKDEEEKEEGNPVAEKSVCKTTTSTTGSATESRKLLSAWSSQKEDDLDEDEEDIVMCEVWYKEDKKTLARWKTRTSVDVLQKTSAIVVQNDEKVGAQIRTDGWAQSIILTPCSWMHFVWGILTCILMSFDLVYLPLEVFEPPRILFVDIMIIVTTAFWTLDICMMFLTGYYSNGCVEMRPGMIAKAYLQTWFTVDFIVCILDWGSLIHMRSNGANADTEKLGALRMNKVLRAVRILRLFRLLRLFKVAKTFSSLGEKLHSDIWLMMFTILKLIIGIGVINHFIACAWFAVGTIGKARGHGYSWIEKHEDLFGDAWTFSFSYATALHWSLTQFTPAGMEVVPWNIQERCFNIVVILFALISISSLVSNITGLVTQLRHKNQEIFTQQEKVRQYIIANNLSLELGNRIVNFHRQWMRRKRVRMHESDVKCIEAMPESLRWHLHIEVYMPVLLRHSLFVEFFDTHPAGPNSVCHYCMFEETVQPSEELFKYKQRCDRMYFLVHGELDYFLGRNEEHAAVLTEDEHFCEMAIWLMWDHRGRCMAPLTTMAELVVLDAVQFQQIICVAPGFQNCRLYAQIYAAHLEHLQDEGEKVSDIWLNKTVIDQLSSEAFLSAREELEKRAELKAEHRDVGGSWKVAAKNTFRNVRFSMLKSHRTSGVTAIDP
mmetsp:Transcript_46443/g.104374  ORF Transcript_46443/g.104374 Transcript_46443/m.104374 type:complete len:914 (+) Transcript_46443:78-2819(+)